jgi:hypothetical protein
MTTTGHLHSQDSDQNLGQIRPPKGNIWVTHQFRSCLDHGSIERRRCEGYMFLPYIWYDMPHAKPYFTSDRPIKPECQPKRFGITLRIAKLQINKSVCRISTTELCSAIIAWRKDGKENFPYSFTDHNSTYSSHHQAAFSFTRTCVRVRSTRLLNTGIMASCSRREEAGWWTDSQSLCHYTIDSKIHHYHVHVHCQIQIQVC